MYVALLRGINVGGKHIVPMKELAALFAKEGCTDVKTYLQSGNVLFTAEPETVTTLADRMSQRIVARFGFKAPVVIRTSSEIRAVATLNPFMEHGSSEEMLHVYFLATQPMEETLAGLDPERSLPDEFRVRGQEVYLKLPRGMAYTKLTNAYFDLKLRTVSTCRNWRTVLKLADMVRA